MKSTFPHTYLGISEAADDPCFGKIYTFPFMVCIIYYLIFGYFRLFFIFNLWVSPLRFSTLQLQTLGLLYYAMAMRYIYSIIVMCDDGVRSSRAE